jgi:hypothetical protein
MIDTQATRHWAYRYCFNSGKLGLSVGQAIVFDQATHFFPERNLLIRGAEQLQSDRIAIKIE